MAEVKYADWRVDVYADDATARDPDFKEECDGVRELIELIVEHRLSAWPGARYEVQ